MIIWSKTILSVYRYLENISNAIDNLVRKKCIYSSFYSVGRGNDVYDYANKIIALSERKVQLINLKVITEEALMRLKPTDRKILLMFYVDGMKNKQIADVLNMPLRTLFRRKMLAINSFDAALKAMGYTDVKLNEMFSDEKWLNNVYSRTLKHELNTSREANELVNEYRLMKEVMHEFRSIGSRYYNYV